MISFKNTISQLLPRSPRINDDDYRKGQLLISVVLIKFFFNVISLPIYLADKFYIGLFCALLDMFVLTSLYFFYKKSEKYRLSNHFFSIRGNFFVLALTLNSGGLYSPFASWLVTIPITAFLLGKPRHGYIWLVIVNLEYVILLLASYFFPVAFPVVSSSILSFLGIFGLLMYLWCIILIYEQSRFLAKRYIEINKDKIKAQKENLISQKDILERKQKEIILQNELLESQSEIILSVNYRLANVAQDKAQKLAQTHEELDLFLYRSSHDLRRPITAILGLLELIKLESEEILDFENVAMLLDKVLLTAVNMDKMLRKLIMISEVNHENSPASLIDFDKITQKLLNFSEDRFPDMPVDIDFFVEEHKKLDFYQNAILLEIILLNILENAISFQNPRNDHATVDINVKIEKKQAIIIIQDNGVGIMPEYLDKVFNLFFKASTKSENNGLGLYIVKKATEKMKGNIFLESQPIFGTKLTLVLPNLNEESNQVSGIRKQP